MSLPTISHRTIRLLIPLAVAQIVGWGTIGLPAIAGSAMALDLHLTLTAIFGGTAVFYVVMGVLGPVLAPLFVRHGARRLMVAGSCLAALGLCGLAIAHGPLGYFGAWAVLGAAGAATLSTAAYIYLNQVLGQAAKRAIGALMLLTGLSTSIFWPLTGVLMDQVGWRGTCFVFAITVIGICVPIYAFGLPAAALGEPTRPVPSVRDSGRRPVASTFYLVACAIALNAFVTFGLSSVLIEVLKADGLAQADAIALGSLLGLIQVFARGLDFLGGARWDGLTTGIVACCLVPVSMGVLMVTGGGPANALVFVGLYGIGSGGLAVARATIPLVFYDREDYARAASQIALPLNLLSASAPPVMAALLTQFDVSPVLCLCAGCSTLALAILVALRGRRPHLELAPAE